MITEDKKYVSGILRNVGFAFLSPVGGMAFQYLLFETKFTIINVLVCIVLALVGWIFFYMGYNNLKRQKK